MRYLMSEKLNIKADALNDVNLWLDMKHLVRCVKREGFVKAHHQILSRHDINYTTKLWDYAIEKDFIKRAKDGRLVLTNKGKTAC